MPLRPAMLILVGVFLAAPAHSAWGQTLSERIAQVRRQHAEEKAALKPDDVQTKILRALSYTPVTLHFVDTPARDALEFIATLLDCPVTVRYSDDAIGHGLDPATPITLDVQDMNAAQALDLILEQCSIIEPCTWQLRRSFLEIGTKERLSVPSARVTRVYPIDEMLFEAPRFDNAPLVGFSEGYPGWVGAYDGGRGGYLYGGGYRYGYGSPGGGPSGYSGAIAPGPNTATSGSAVTSNTPQAKRERAEEVVDLIVSIVEPDAWTRNGGAWAEVRYVHGSLVVTAPDYVQRQLGGYPAVSPVSQAASQATSQAAGQTPAEAAGEPKASGGPAPGGG